MPGDGTIFQGYIRQGIPVCTRGIFGGRTELTEVSSAGIEVAKNIPKCQLQASSSYRTIPECSVGSGGRTEALHRGKCPRYTLPEVLGTGIELVPNHPGVFGRAWRPYRTTSV